jgi:hypothetical protein
MASSAVRSSRGSSRSVGARRALLELAQDRAAERAGSILEAIDHHPADPGPAQLEQDACVCGSQVGVDQEGEGGKKLPDSLDAMGPGLAPAQVRVHHRHVYGLGADRFHGFGPTARGDPLEAVGVERPESENTFRGDGSEEQMSQNGPYLSQKGP